MDNRGFYALFIFLGSIAALFLIAPLFKLFWGVGAAGLTEAFGDTEILSSIALTMRTALAAVAFVALTGIPLAYLVARHDFPGKAALESLIDLPVMVPHTAAGIALLAAFGNGWVQRMGLDFVDSTTGIVAAMAFLSAPFLINGAKEGFKKVDVRYEHVARTLGAGRFGVFWRIALPGARQEILNGALMMWSRALGEFGAVVIIAYHPMVAPVLIYDRFNSYGLKYSAPVAAAMILVSVVVFILVRWLNNRSNRI